MFAPAPAETRTFNGKVPISALPYRTDQMETRFWAKVEKTPTCWIWQGSFASNGYGQFFVRHGHGTNGKPRPYLGLAHRVAYELCVGSIPDGLTIDHLCRNKGCVNPAHLEPVTHRENMRRSTPHNAKKTHCPKGHPYDRIDYWTDRVTGERKSGRRCDTCRKAQERARFS